MIDWLLRARHKYQYVHNFRNFSFEFNRSHMYLSIYRSACANIYSPFLTEFELRFIRLKIWQVRKDELNWIFAVWCMYEHLLSSDFDFLLHSGLEVRLFCKIQSQKSNNSTAVTADNIGIRLNYIWFPIVTCLYIKT